MNEQLIEIRKRWASLNDKKFLPASDKAILDFQKKIGLILPSDLVEYVDFSKKQTV